MNYYHDENPPAKFSGELLVRCRICGREFLSPMYWESLCPEDRPEKNRSQETVQMQIKVKVIMPGGQTREANLDSISRNRILVNFGRMLTLYEFDRRGRGKRPLLGWRIDAEDLERILSK